MVPICVACFSVLEQPVYASRGLVMSHCVWHAWPLFTALILLHLIKGAT